MIQYWRSLQFDSSSTLAVLIKTRTNICHGIMAHTFWGFHGEHQVNTENLHQRVETQCSGGSKISFHPAASSLANFKGTIIEDLYYNSTLLSCTRATKEASRFWGVVNFCPLIKRIFHCIFWNKHMHLLTRVYGTNKPVRDARKLSKSRSAVLNFLFNKPVFSPHRHAVLILL